MIWNEKPEEHLMAFGFLCNGNSTLVEQMINYYKNHPRINFFNDLVKPFCVGGNNQSLNKSPANNTIEVFQNDERRSMSFNLLII